MNSKSKLRNTIKSFLILSLLPIVSCSKSDDGASSTASINPPEWIQGTWLSSTNGFRFTQNDFVSIVLNTETSHKGLLDLSSKDASTDEVKTDGTYNLKMTFTAGQSTTYEFSRKSESVIVWENHVLNPEYIKQ
ncbi:hypothetical protein [Flagellimonas myxillae]|uniref:hypothetical protein n=1 Tax=Flagellimonas myxillae TaxID=2942214 RepID=UPI00201F555E|nr:hypothetical protein [Muricauda myxillae]MCL6264932.1 hypothetical protein [Muricauda myxillae]